MAALWRDGGPAPSGDVLDRFAAVEAGIWSRAGAVDAAAALPVRDIAALHGAGLLTAVVPPLDGAEPLVRDPVVLGALLERVGFASLTLGRLFEGHVNAARLILAYGGADCHRVLAAEAAAGRLLGVWNAERGEGLRAARVAGGWRLAGRKVYCSGSGHVRRPVVTAKAGDAGVLMLLPDMEAEGVSVDTGDWRASGMRGTATGTVTFADAFVADAAVLGGVGDYYRPPLFSGGAWRVLAVQLGGLRRITALHADALRSGGRSADPVARARFAQAAGALECARLLIAEAARRAEGAAGEPAGDRADGSAASAAIDAYVDHTRATFETLALEAIEAARRNAGLGSFIAPHPLDRCVRDLETYLRQPFLDASRDNAAGWLLPRAGAWT